jgi:hypothetical protein
MSNKASEKPDMSELAWASEQLRERVAPRGSVKERIRNAALTLGWRHSRARTIWYADERASIKPKELRRIEEVTGIAYGRKELRSVEALIARADTLAATQADESVYSAFAAAFRAFIGALDRSGTRGE